jgi:hypothetical protein
MTTKEERPWRGSAKAVEGDTHTLDSTAAPSPADIEAAELPLGIVTLAQALARLAAELAAELPALRAALLDRQAAPPRLTYRLSEIAAALGVSRRLMEQARAAGRLPRADLHIGRVSLWRTETIRDWLSQQADRQGRRSRS